MRTTLSLAVLFGLVGCGGDKGQPAFSELNAVTGVVKRNGQPVKGGKLTFTLDPDKQEFGVNAVVGSDGTYTLTTYRLTDSSGERKPGAPAGTYKVTYVPDITDQTSGGSMEPVRLTTPVTVAAGANTLNIDLPASKK
ncbi:MAG: hypothetical protein U0791_13800 [Gemmataceae bacterium]